jgi:hypothetical protein
VLAKAAVFATLPLAGHHHPAVTQHVTVQPGDTLSSIAVAQCGKVNDWTGIWAHSRAIVGPDPNLITPGERLKVVCKDPASLLQYGQTAAPAKAAPVAAAHVHTYACGDGDGDGYDMPCSELNGGQAASPAAAPAAAPAQQTSYSGAPGSFQSCVISRESGGNASAVNPASGAGGLYQFLPSTWAALGFSGLPENAPVSVQNAAFAKAYAESGTSPWSAYDGC